MGGVKPESVYIDNTQLERQDQKKPKPKPTQMVMRSDTFDDGRLMSRNSSMPNFDLQIGVTLHRIYH